MSRQAAIIRRERESSRLLAGVEKHAATVAVATLTFWLAYDGGSFGITTRNTVAIGVWWAIAVALVLGLWPAAVLTRTAVAGAVFLTALAAFTLASATWAFSAEDAFSEFDRTLLYLGIFLVAVLAWRRGDGARVANGLALGIVATAAVALASRCYPNAIAGDNALRFLPQAQHRLSYPVDYWNALAILVAIAFPLLLRAAVFGEHALLRAVALAPLPALAGAVYLTSSRGGVVTAAAGTVLFLLLTPRRPAALAAAVIGGAGAVAVVAVLHARPQLVNDPGTAAAISQGRSAGVLILAVCVFAGCGRLLLDLAASRLPTTGRRAEVAVALVVLAAVAAGIAAAHPVRRFDAFKQAPANLSQPVPLGSNPTQSHLLSGSGTGRWQEWAAAIDEWRSRPLTGHGAGSYESWWAQHGSLTGFIADAHSLYAEMLGELGVVGFALLVAALALGLVSGVDRLREGTAPVRGTVAALLAAFACYLIGAGIDWMWEMPIVSIVGVTTLGLLVGPATAPAGTRESRGAPVPIRWLGLGVAILLATGALYTEAVPIFAQLRLRESQTAFGRGDAAGAVQAANDAQHLEPWAASPYLQHALVAEGSGDLAGARSSIDDAIRHDRYDWRLWLVRARVDTKAGRIADAARSLRRAASLNPRSPLFSGVRPTG